MPIRILIFYGTSYGQTAKVAQFIEEHLTSHGAEVTIVNGDQPPRSLSVNDFDGIIVGASIITGHYQKCVRRFVLVQHDALNRVPSAFFSVSGSAASHEERGKAEAKRCIDDFLHKTGWRPAMIESVAGATAYTKYNPFVRWMLKQISKRNGGPTDTSRDYEFTDWAQVGRFADAFVSKVQYETVPLTSV